ncbi:MAG: Fe-S protein assembly co-chaperone HscB [Rickettsiaceae bacterium]|nr:Fe-S protein assembly co-chaperone HscB [Rickettsiaceae bacterium]MDP4832548.1 Fe-S protein assembly co-chaperone HscB [Rickettsiaceae bacterium]MDP5020210.1 Fe-S protein assembly co-chaperone HscB [Rickettsiaceae bacterium]MDP5082894.1 Fe-S protein assembly co-chaperone HscB [Rickettsiaceae bacterium]
MNHFELLNLEQRYDIEPSVLLQQYLLKQALYHPDRANSDSDRIENLNISMQLNEAYKTLKDDCMRAEYLLTILGQKFDDRFLRDALTASELEAIIELHEELDLIDAVADLQSLKDNKIVEKTQMVRELTECFEGKNITKALDITLRLKYLTNLVKNIDLKIKHANSRD